MGNNSGSIKHRAITFACSMLFLTTANRLVGTAISLSRGWKWPRVTKCTRSRKVRLRLEGNLVFNLPSSRVGKLCVELWPCHGQLSWKFVLRECLLIGCRGNLTAVLTLVTLLTPTCIYILLQLIVIFYAYIVHYELYLYLSAKKLFQNMQTTNGATKCF